MKKRSAKPKGVLEVKSRGKVYRYAWRGGPRLFAEPGTPAFEREYAQALEDERVDRGSFASLIHTYRKSAEFIGLAPRTRKDMDAYLQLIEDKFGFAALAAMDDRRMRAKVKAWRDSMAATPRKADLAIEALRRVINFGIDNGEMDRNVASRIATLHRSDRSAEIWTQEDIDQVTAQLTPAGQRAVMFMRWSGLRREDACRITWSADKGSHLEWRTGKSRGRNMVIIPVLPGLRALLDAMPKTQAVTILTSSRGRSWTPDGLSTAIDRAKRKAGVSKHLHDLRGTFATDLMLAGLDDRDIAEIMGWRERDVARIRRIYVNREAHLRAVITRLENKP